MPSLPVVIAGIAGVALTAYVVMAGADFGGGIWDLLASGPRQATQRALIAHAMGPVWEANHVWLILVIVLLFTCFPPAFAALATVLHIPLSVLLIGIVLRGSAFAFRSYEDRPSAAQERWGLLFAIASMLTPVVLGMIVGAIASGNVGIALASAARGGAPFTDVYIGPWLTPFTIGVGLMALVLCALLAATYLTVEASGDPALANDFRWRAIGAAVLLPVAAYATLALSKAQAPPFPVQGAAFLAGLAALIALGRHRYRAARAAMVALAGLVLWGWMIAQYPYLIPPRLTITDAASPPATLRAFVVAIAIGAAVLLPSLWYLLNVFRRAHASH